MWMYSYINFTLLLVLLIALHWNKKLKSPQWRCLRLVFFDMMPYRLIFQDCTVDGGSKLIQNMIECSKSVDSSVKGYVCWEHNEYVWQVHLVYLMLTVVFLFTILFLSSVVLNVLKPSGCATYSWWIPQIRNVLEQVMIWSIVGNSVVIDVVLWDCTVKSILTSFSTVWKQMWQQWSMVRMWWHFTLVSRCFLLNILLEDKGFIVLNMIIFSIGICT
jgi:hypothetical protein